MFKKVNSKQNFPELEKRILQFWERKRIFEKLREKNRGKKRWSFLDGPITANNPMGVHHAWGRTYKDLFQRYKAMQGFDQRFQNGFDCQGLWIEVEVEKELGFKSKKDIERYGIEKFVKKCKERVRKYSAIQTQQSIRLGQWMDWENSYYTMSDENNYAIWHFLKKCHQMKVLYKGKDVVPWCMRCGTAISQHEILTEEYKEISHPSIFLKLKIRDQRALLKNGFLLVWTTTPWTLAANVAVAVHPDKDYLLVKTGKEQLILAKARLDVLDGDYEILDKFKGKKLVGLKYQGPFDDLTVNKKIRHRVIAWDEVSEEEGTGLVHIAPGCGEEDFQLSKEKGLDVIAPIDEAGNYLKGFGWLEGRNVAKVADAIFKDLKKKSLVYKIEDFLHRYPTCWRCKSELVFRLVDEWYISMDKLRKPMMEIARKIKWIPSFGLERELDWLKNMKDWLISKKRYWGLALPIFECRCGNFQVIGSYKELQRKAKEGWKEFEGHSPHRPWVDKIKIKCSRCGRLIPRIPDVGNPWLDAGIVPFSTMGYFTSRDYWRQWFPADFICESFPGQFRNWFYSLIAMSTVLESSEPFKTVLGYALVRDEKGEEMHKSKGNVIWFDEAVEKMGADVMRWMYLSQNPALNLNFGYGPAKEVYEKIRTLWNTYVFFVTYANIRKSEVGSRKSESDNLLDRWINSRLNELNRDVLTSLDKYQPQKAMKAFDDFIEDLSNWYLRRSRKRFQKLENIKESRQAFQTLYYVLVTLCKLLAPFVPFVSEEIYQSLVCHCEEPLTTFQGKVVRGDEAISKSRFTGTREIASSASPRCLSAARFGLLAMTERGVVIEPSIHLCDYPQPNRKFIDKKLNEKMRIVRQIVGLGLKARAEAGIRVRQPLSTFRVSPGLPPEVELKDLIREELNVKRIRGTKKKIKPEKGWVIESDDKITVALNTKITPQLRQEGLARELVRRIQDMRKDAGYKFNDIITIQWSSRSPLLRRTIERWGDYIRKETLALELVAGGKARKERFDVEREMEMEGGKIWIGIRKK